MRGLPVCKGITQVLVRAGLPANSKWHTAEMRKRCLCWLRHYLLASITLLQLQGMLHLFLDALSGDPPLEDARADGRRQRQHLQPR